MTERRKMKKPENVWFLLGALAVLAMGKIGRAHV